MTDVRGDFVLFRDRRDYQALQRVFSAVVPRFEKRLFGVLQPADVDDVIQQTLLEVALHPQDWRGEGSVLAWMYGILTNKARDRQNQRRVNALPDEILLQDPRSRKGANAVKTLAEEAVDAINGLPVPYRETARRRLLLGESFSSIASSTNTPAPTIRKRVERALELLRTQLHG